ncbi:MAG: DEAD/DEAH box helicase [Methanobacteriaceae archaeon]|nr:DEAD/DEAH box helicase [Methanobacteriaceae archaeon]
MIIDILNYFQEKKWYRDRIEHIETIPVRRPYYTNKPLKLPEEIQQYLDNHNIKLYTHQYQMLEHVRNKENVTITTPTASGKTLSFTLPIVEDLYKNPKDTALYIYPTKALANDQLKTLNQINDECNLNIHPGKYDGDTPKKERVEIKERSRLVLTNPYELHLILPWHHQWERFYKNLKYIIIDEAHQYRGVFGSNMALLIRRLKRICKYYGSNPQFILSTATLANAQEFSEKLTGLPFTIVDKDGSPAGKKYFVFYNPYVRETNVQSIHQETLDLFNTYITHGLQTICFEVSRKMAELVALWSKNEMRLKHPELENKITAYRAGYTVEERKKIENKLKKGELIGISTTNALELGINIGSLDSVIISGYPGTLISTWQQAGRAGRSNKESLVTLLSFQNPLDQYFMKHPETFFNTTHEHAIIDLNNQQILRGHLKCAAYEIPLKLNEIESFGFDDEGIVLDEINDLEMDQTLKYYQNSWKYNLEDNPNFKVNLNDVLAEPFKVFNKKTFLEEMSQKQAYREAHENAILIHNGETYIVTKLDLKTKYVQVKKQKTDHHTQALKEIDINIIKTEQTKEYSELIVNYGTVNVTENYTKYNILKFNKITGSKKLKLPPLNFKTKGIWFTIPYKIREILKEKLDSEDKFNELLQGCLQGVQNAIIAMTPFHVMCDTYDLDGVSQILNNDTAQPTIFIYDAFEGGVGLTKKAYNLIDQIFEMTYELIRDCDCEEGCPACIYSSQPTEKTHLNKKGTFIILENLKKMTKKDE